MASRDMNLMVPYMAKPEESKESTTKRILILSFVMLILVFSAVYAKLFIDNMALTNELDDLTAYIESPLNIESYNEALRLGAYTQQLAVRKQAVEQAWSCIGSYPLINSRVLDAILECTNRYYKSTPQINTYDSASGKLNFDTFASAVTQTAEYVKSLEDSGFFSSVEYRGYEYSELDDAFRINVECILSENAGK